MPEVTAQPSPGTFEWRRWPETESFLDSVLERGLEGNAFARSLADRLPGETGTRFKVWVDHVVVKGTPALARKLQTLGYQREPEMHDVVNPVYGHPGGVFPRVVIQPGDDSANGAPEAAPVVEIALKVESVAAFSRAHDLGLEIEGYALGPYRVARIPGARTSLAVVERRAYRDRKSVV